MAALFLSRDTLVPWLAELAASRRTLVPRREGDAILFRPFAGGVEPELVRRATRPPKDAVFPQCEPLLAFHYVKDAEDPGRTRLNVEETIDGAPAVVVGARPCDAAGFAVFDRVYLDGPYTDLNYQARRRETLFVVLACERPATTCFCNGVGGGPADTAGADVLMTPLADGWLLEPVTDAGRTLLASPLLADGAARTDEARAVRAAAEARMPPTPDLTDAPEKLRARFDDKGFWEAMSDKCLSCGACTYLCPTCYCFNITDERCGMEGVRLRTWDNCMSAQFTQEASGHNPRPVKADRLRNRVGHKFAYYPALHDGRFACVGCGRCIRSCPVSVDIRAIVTAALAAPAAVEE